jgi:hypothetical protein
MSTNTVLSTTYVTLLFVYNRLQAQQTGQICCTEHQGPGQLLKAVIMARRAGLIFFFILVILIREIEVHVDGKVILK